MNLTVFIVTNIFLLLLVIIVIGCKSGGFGDTNVFRALLLSYGSREELTIGNYVNTCVL